MSEENQAAEQQQLTPEQVVEQINGFRDGIIKLAVDNKLNFEVVFNATSQAVSMFVFDYLLLSDGELSDENVAATVAKFNAQTEGISKVGLENMRAHAKAQQEAEVPQE